MVCFSIGYLNNTDISRDAHLSILRNAGALDDSSLLQGRAQMTLGPLYQGIYIDDGILALPVSRRVLRQPGRDDVLASAAVGSRKQGLP